MSSRDDRFDQVQTYPAIMRFLGQANGTFRINLMSSIFWRMDVCKNIQNHCFVIPTTGLKFCKMIFEEMAKWCRANIMKKNSCFERSPLLLRISRCSADLTQIKNA